MGAGGLVLTSAFTTPSFTLASPPSSSSGDTPPSPPCPYRKPLLSIDSSSGRISAVLTQASTPLYDAYSFARYFCAHSNNYTRAARGLDASQLLSIRVRVHIICHARNNMYVNLSHAWLQVAD